MTHSCSGASASVVHLPHNVELPIIFYQGQPVITLAMMDKAHQRPERTANRNFLAHKDKLIEGEDYFQVCAHEIREHKIMPLSDKAHGTVILLTQTGYLMLVKSFTDDLAWQVQRELVKNYFRKTGRYEATSSELTKTQLKSAFREARWLAQYRDGEIHFEPLPSNAFVITPEEYISVLRTPHIFPSVCLPEVLAACAERIESLCERRRAAA